jgi:peptide/nickel transport system ATP-binding protein
MAEPLLEVVDLSVDYRTDAADVRAVNRVSFTVEPGEFLGIVGESGSGKSTLLFGVAQLLSPPGEVVEGKVTFRGHDMVRLTGSELRHIRWRDFSVVMQSAMNALNPMKSIGAQFEDTLRAHEKLSGSDVRERSALDVVAQRSLMTKIRDLQQALGFAVIFVTHDMSVVSRYSDRMLVMYAGQIAEAARTGAMFTRPLHPYTRGLMNAFPSVTGPRRELAGIPGAPPDLARPPSGCRFHPRCPEVMPQCRSREPELYRVGDAEVRCLLYAEHAPEPR